MNSVEFLVGEVISSKLINRAGINARSAVLDSADFGQVGRVVVFESFVEGDLASKLLQIFSQLVDIPVVTGLDRICPSLVGQGSSLENWRSLRVQIYRGVDVDRR